jgi:hypothetical protein
MQSIKSGCQTAKPSYTANLDNHECFSTFISIFVLRAYKMKSRREMRHIQVTHGDYF